MYSKKLINIEDINGRDCKYIELFKFKELKEGIKNDIIDTLLMLPEDIYKNATADNFNGYGYSIDYQYLVFFRKAIKIFSDASGMYINDAFYFFNDAMTADRQYFISMIEVTFDDDKILVYEDGTVYRPSDLKAARREGIELIGLLKLL